MYPSDFYNDHKYCEHCQDYVPYLQSLEKSFCSCCGAEVSLFSGEDWQSFLF